MTLFFDRELVDRFLREEQIEGVDEKGGFAYRLDLSAPSVATAIHAGHKVRKELIPLMALDEAGRLFEEDAATDEMIQGAPSAIWGLDSRSEYDLNRPPELTLPLTPERFWGTRVYQEQPTAAMNETSMAKYQAFYCFLSSWLQALIKKHGAAVVYDIHSYNITRQVEKGIEHPPVFNLGTELLDKDRWGNEIQHWLQLLGTISVPGHEISAAENSVFFGRAHLCRSLTEASPAILVLPTEVSKIYMEELKGVLKPDVVKAIKKGFQDIMARHTRAFVESQTS